MAKRSAIDSLDCAVQKLPHFPVSTGSPRESMVCRARRVGRIANVAVGETAPGRTELVVQLGFVVHGKADFNRVARPPGAQFVGRETDTHKYTLAPPFGTKC